MSHRQSRCGRIDLAQPGVASQQQHRREGTGERGGARLFREEKEIKVGIGI